MSTEHVYWPFDVLGFTKIPTEKRDVKRAYAKRLKQIDQSADPQGFQDLRQAYEAAIGELDYIAQSNTAPPTPAAVTIPYYPPAFTAPDQPAAPQPDENQVDWARVHELCAQIEKPNNTEKNVERFRRIINDPVFQDIDAAHELESAIYQYATSTLQYIERHAEFAPQISDVLPLIDERFGWYSDSVAFQSRFYPTPQFMMALANKLAPIGEFKAPIVGLHMRLAWITSLPSRPRFWYSWGLVFLLNSNLSSYISDYTWPFIIGLPLLIIFVGVMLVIAEIVRNKFWGIYNFFRSFFVFLKRIAKMLGLKSRS